MLAGGEQRRELRPGMHHATGRPPPTALPRVMMSGRTTLPDGIGQVLMPKPLAGPAAAGPDLIEDQCEALVVAELADAGGVVGGIEVHPALALDRLHDDAAGVGINRRQQRHRSRRPRPARTRDIRLEAFAVLRVAGGREHRQRPAMEALLQRDDLVPVLPAGLSAQAGKLAGGLIRFGAALAEERLAGEGDPAEALGHLDLRQGPEGVADVPERGSLLRSGLNQRRVAVAENRPTEAGKQIDILLAIGIPQVRARCRAPSRPGAGRSCQ